MKKESIGSLFLGKWDTKTIVTVGIGAALFGVLMNYGGIPVFTNTSLTTAMIVPVVVGAMYGPLPAAVACGVGNVIADLIGGWGIYPAWAIANAVAGCFIGALPLYGARITEGKFDVKHLVWYVVCVVVGIIAIVVVVYFRNQQWTKLQCWAIMGIVGGGIGNLIDRIRLNYVVDFLDFIIFKYDFPVFNISDILINIGVIAVIVILLKNKS